MTGRPSPSVEIGLRDGPGALLLFVVVMIVLVLIAGPALAWVVHFAQYAGPMVDVYLSLWPPEFRGR